MTVQSPASYPARLDIDYQEQHNRVTTLFRLVLSYLSRSSTASSPPA